MDFLETRKQKTTIPERNEKGKKTNQMSLYLLQMTLWGSFYFTAEGGGFQVELGNVSELWK